VPAKIFSEKASQILGFLLCLNLLAHPARFSICHLELDPGSRRFFSEGAFQGSFWFDAPRFFFIEKPVEIRLLIKNNGFYLFFAEQLSLPS
jgi:hypothetical protein